MTAKSGAEALSNADAYSSYDVGMCLQWVRGGCWEVGSFYGSAIDAWDGAADKHPGDRHPPAGAPMFWSGGQYGHVAIARGDESDDMRSTDCQSSGRVGNADSTWPEVHWNSSYLGWCGDLNGVTLPLDTDEDPDGDDDVPDYDHGACTKEQPIAAGQWATIAWQSATGAGAFTEGSKTVKLSGKIYSAVVHAVLEAPPGSTVKIRTVETADGKDQETNPQTEFPATSGNTAVTHAQNGACKSGRAWAVRVTCTEPATLVSADAVVLSW